MPKFEVISEVRLTTVDLVDAETMQEAVALVKQTSKEPLKATVENDEVIRITEIESFDPILTEIFETTDPRYLAELEKEFVLTST